MNKTLLVYYTLEGNTGFAAQTAAETAEMDIERLVPEKEPPKAGFGKFFWGGKSVVMKEKPSLAPLAYDPSDYDNIIFAFPIWAGSYPPAVASYLKDHAVTGKNCFVIACSAGGNAAKAVGRLAEKLPGCTIKDTLSLVDPASDKEKNKVLIKEFIERNFPRG